MFVVIDPNVRDSSLYGERSTTYCHVYSTVPRGLSGVGQFLTDKMAADSRQRMDAGCWLLSNPRMSYHRKEERTDWFSMKGPAFYRVCICGRPHPVGMGMTIMPWLEEG